MKKNYKKGLIREVLIIVIALIILGYFGFNINNIISSGTVQTNLNWFWQIVMTIWSWISAPIIYLWNLAVSLFNAGVSNIPQP